MEADYAEALVIKADGSLEVTGVVDGEFFESKGTIKVVNNKMIYKLDNGDEWEGRFEMTKGESFTMVWDDEFDIRYTYRYCENDLSDEVVGMWVCNESASDSNKIMYIMTYNEDGTAEFTGASTMRDEHLLSMKFTYKVVGNLLFRIVPEEDLLGNIPPLTPTLLTYNPNGTSLGDILTQRYYVVNDEYEVEESVESFVRVKQNLNLTGITYDYNTAYVTNAKGKDEDFSIMGHTFNIAKMEAGDFDMMFRSELFCVELNANSFKHKFLLDNGQSAELDIPFTVEGNKVTLDMSVGNPALRKVEMYMFQDADDSQLHIYMPTQSFINYFANLEFVTLFTEGKIDPTDTAAVEKVFSDMDARVESINVSFVFKARK